MTEIKDYKWGYIGYLEANGIVEEENATISKERIDQLREMFPD